MAGFGVSVSSITSTATEVRNQNSRMKNGLDDATQSINTLLRAWDGDAAKQASQVAGNMATLFEQFNKEVESFARFLDEAAANWSASETANVSNEQSNASQFRS